MAPLEQEACQGVPKGHLEWAGVYKRSFDEARIAFHHARRTKVNFFLVFGHLVWEGCKSSTSEGVLGRGGQPTGHVARELASQPVQWTP